MTQLYRAALIHTFGRGGAQPLKTAILRLSGLSIGALGLGILFAWSVRNLPLASSARPGAILFAGIFTIQITIILALLASARLTGINQHDTFARLLLHLPLGAIQRGILLLLPSLVLAGLTLLLAGWSLGLVMAHLGLPALLLPVVISFGTLSGLGLLFGLQFMGAWRFGIVPFILWTEYKLVDICVAGGRLHTIAAIDCGVLLVASAALFIRSVPHVAASSSRRQRATTAHLTSLPPAFWFAKKMLRSRTLPYNFATTLLLSAGVTVIGRRQGFTDPSMLSLLGALLAGSFAADIRSVARRYRPAEITALWGTLRFSSEQIVSALAGSFVIALPLALLIGPSNLPAFAAQVMLGIAAGLLAGTIIVPEARDIVGQFLAVLLILTLLAGLPQLPGVESLSNSIGQTGLAIACAAIALAMEYKRNPYKWRNA